MNPISSLLNRLIYSQFISTLLHRRRIIEEGRQNVQAKALPRFDPEVYILDLVSEEAVYKAVSGLVTEVPKMVHL